MLYYRLSDSKTLSDRERKKTMNRSRKYTTVFHYPLKSVENEDSEFIDETVERKLMGVFLCV